MPISNAKLWQNIADWPLPSVMVFLEGEKSFQDRLQDIGGRSAEDTASVVREYRRFLYLKAVTGQLLTPPKAVDTAWHLHLEQVADWMAFQVATGRALPHQTSMVWPSNKEAYLSAHGVYRQEFDETPPVPISPEPGNLERLLWEQRLAVWTMALCAALLLIAPFLKGGWGMGLFVAATVLGVMAITKFKSSGLGPQEISNCG